LRKLDKQSEAVKELEKLSREFRDKTTRLIVLQTQLDQLDSSFTQQKHVTELVSKKLHDTE
jgi:hypothetical protein